MLRSMIAIAVLLVPLAGTALAGNGQNKADESLVTLDLRLVNGKLLYLDENLQVWEEANGAKGLQRAKMAMSAAYVKEPDARASGP